MVLYQLDEFAAPQLLGFIRSLLPPDDYTGAKWLPNETVTDPEFEYILGANRRPVMATIMGYDSETPLHSRPGSAGKVSGEMPLIKRKAKVNEKVIQRFLTPRAGLPDQEEAVRSVYVSLADLFDSVQARVEWLRMQALSEDKVVYSEDGVTFSFDFGLTDQYQITLGATAGSAVDGTGATRTDFSAGAWWTDLNNSNPVLDLAALCDYIQKISGKRPVEYVCSSSVLPLFYRNKNLAEMIRGANAPSAVLTPGEIQTLFSLYNLPPITTLAGQAPGIFAETYGETEPPSEYTKVAAAAFPTLPQANYLGQLQVAAPGSLG
jgi:hypothetical protein